jgi:hypothetical protein
VSTPAQQCARANQRADAPVTVNQVNHYHGHDKPTRADAQYSAVQLGWMVARRGRRA